MMSTRPILSLKRTVEPERQHSRNWKCRPCGTGFQLAAEPAGDAFVRCPKCNAKLGRDADFRQAEPDLQRLRARPDTVVSPAPAQRPTLTVVRARPKLAPRRLH